MRVVVTFPPGRDQKDDVGRADAAGGAVVAVIAAAGGHPQLSHSRPPTEGDAR